MGGKVGKAGWGKPVQELEYRHKSRRNNSGNDQNFDSLVVVWDDHHEECQLLRTLEIFGNIEASSVFSQG